MDQLIVAHSVPSYLFITGSWIYGQIINLKRFKPIVITGYLQNMDIFPFESVYSLNIQPYLNKKLFAKLYMKVIGNQQIMRKRLQYFEKILNENQVFLLHSHFGDEGFRNLKLKQRLKIPMITSFYGYDISKLIKNPLWLYRYRRLFSEGEVFLVEGNYMKKSLVELGCPEEKVIVQHLGIDLEKIKFEPRKIGKDGKIKILVAGSFREKKGIPYAIEAFGKVREKYKNLRLTLTIIGDSTGASREEKEKEKILTMIDKYQLKSCSKLIGYQPHPVFIRELYKHHIFLSPSIHASDGDTEGGVPVSIIEASASGMPILCTTHCDIPEVVIDGESGYLVPERDADALAEKLGFLVTHPSIWEEMGRKGREHIRRNYNITKQVQKLEEIYDLAIKKVL